MLTAMRTEARLIAQRARSEPIAATSIAPIYETKNLRCSVPVEVRRSVSLFSNVPPLLEDGEVSECDA